MSKDKTTKRDVATILANDSLSSFGSKLKLVMMLSWPAVVAQLSSILMEYIDAAMVGSLGAESAAAIGLVATTTWLFWGIGSAATTGFSVQVAHQIGAGNDDVARSTVRQAFTVVGITGLIAMIIGLAICEPLPHWLGGNAWVSFESSVYFMLFSLTLPIMYLTFMVTAMLRSSGNMIVPGVVNVAMCVLDVIFNALLIFPTREVSVLGIHFTMPGADMGVAGAAIGSGLSVAVCGAYAFYYLIYRSPRLRHPFAGAKHRFGIDRTTLSRAKTISWPVALERVVMCGAQILITAIVAPLGTAAIAANSFAITAESLCYMPGYGVGEAATTLVGQSLGAGRKSLARSFAHISIGAGMTIMAVLGVVMWILAPEMMSIFTTDNTVLSLGTTALRTEAWAEPMFGAAIVTYGVFVGAGYTIVPATINFGSIWAVRLTLSAILAPTYGLFGVWLAMCIELCARGLAFLIVLVKGNWMKKSLTGTK